MALQIKIREDARPLTVEDEHQLDEALRTAAEEARNRGTLAAVLIEAANGNVITMVVGGDETVLGFDYGHHNPPYYSSRGPSNADEPILTCRLTFQHHTQFPRKYVIPIAEGMKAVREFLHPDDLPPCITWGRNCESREDECYGDVTPTECSLQLPPKLTLHNI